MRLFSKVSLSIWDSDHFTGLPTDDARLLFIYMLTSPHSNSAGCFKLSDAYATADMRWEFKRYKAARDALVAGGMIEWDAAHSVVMVAKWFDHNPVMNISHRRGLESQLKKVPSQALREKCQAELDAIIERIEIEKLADENNRKRAGVADLSSRLNTNLMNGGARRV